MALCVDVTDGRGRRIAAAGLAAWLVRAAPGRARGRVAIAIVSDDAMRRLNREYRGVDRVTDVLSFPAREGPGVSARRAARRRPAATDSMLGDIAIARECAARQAREHGHSVSDEWRVLALHGLLHLLGYDHETDQGAMRRAEDRLRRRAGLSAGLIARASGRIARS